MSDTSIAKRRDILSISNKPDKVLSKYNTGIYKPRETLHMSRRSVARVYGLGDDRSTTNGHDRAAATGERTFDGRARGDKGE